tara:strand:+ start:228 stop:338 length:111 start_codon:yes stop_codon:yes gene_type:complete
VEQVRAQAHLIKGVVVEVVLQLQEELLLDLLQLRVV